MYKEDLLSEIEKLEKEIAISEKKTYIINTRVKRLLLFLKDYNSKIQSEELSDLIDELSLCGESRGYVYGGVFDKQQYYSLLDNIKNLLESC